MLVDQPAIDAYASITGDFNPIHLDPAFAATTPMRGIIAHGTMSLGLIWQMIARNLGTCAGATRMTVRFASPVRPGDRIVAGGSEESDGRLSIWVKNQKDEIVIHGHLEAGPQAEGRKAAR
jgi:acyl dehydratase